MNENVNSCIWTMYAMSDIKLTLVLEIQIDLLKVNTRLILENNTDVIINSVLYNTALFC